MADNTPKISLSLLDLLFCAFGGVIVMAVIFISIAGDTKAAKSEKSGHIHVAIVKNNEVLDGISAKMFPDSMKGIESKHLMDDSIYFYGAQFHLYPYGDFYTEDFANSARLSFRDYSLDTLYLKLSYENITNRVYNGTDLKLRVARFQHAEWDTIYIDFPFNIPNNSHAVNGIKIPLR